MAKTWVITIEPTDQSAGPRTVDTISGRKKIAQVEEYLCEMFVQMMPNADKDDLVHFINRQDGSVTRLHKAPYTIKAELQNA